MGAPRKLGVSGFFLLAPFQPNLERALSNTPKARKHSMCGGDLGLCNWKAPPQKTTGDSRVGVPSVRQGQEARQVSSLSRPWPAPSAAKQRKPLLFHQGNQGVQNGIPNPGGGLGAIGAPQPDSLDLELGD